MSKLGTLITGFKALLRTPSLINAVIDHEDRYKKMVHEKYPFPQGLPLIDFGAICEAEDQLDHYLFLDGGSLITDLLLLKNLAKQTPNCTYFEIGTWRGESVINVVDQTEKSYSFNLSNEQLKQLGYNAQYLSQIERLSKDHPNIVHLKGDSQTFDFQALDFKPNLVFIDGDHRTEAVAQDTSRIFDWIDPENCTIVWHDYGYSPEKVRWSVLLGLLNGCPEQYHKHLYHVSHTKCAIFTKKDFNSRPLVCPETIQKNFKIKTLLSDLN